MRFYHRITLALVLIYLFGDNVLGAPGRGRYQWMNCKPDGNNANCTEMMAPLVEMTGLPYQLPRADMKNIVPPVESSEETVQAFEQSGEGSGDLRLIPHSPALSEEVWMNNGLEQEAPQTQEQSLEIEGSGEVDYANDIIPERMKPQLSDDDLKQDNMIQ